MWKINEIFHTWLITRNTFLPIVKFHYLYNENGATYTAQGFFFKYNLSWVEELTSSKILLLVILNELITQYNLKFTRCMTQYKEINDIFLNTMTNKILKKSSKHLKLYKSRNI